MARPLDELPPELRDYDGIQRELAERRLSHFIRQAWGMVETAPYKANWHIECIAEHLEAVTRGQLNGILLINIPFRCMKSLTVNVFWPAWTWAQNPDPRREGHGLRIQPGTWAGPGVKVLSLSHKAPVAVRDSVKTRRLLDSAWYRRNWADRVKFTSDQNEKMRFENTAGGYRLSSSRAGPIGEGGDIVICDDLISREDAHSETVRTSANETVDQTISSRFTDPERSVFVIIMQRLHQDDPAGHILNTWTEEKNVTHLMLPMEFEPQRCCYSRLKTRGGGDQPVQARYLRSKTRWVLEGEAPHEDEQDEWEKSLSQTVYRLDKRARPGALLWPDRFDADRVRIMASILGAYSAAGQLQQRPAPREGGMFSREKFEIVDAAPPLRKIVRHWDLAATKKRQGNDPAWTAGIKMGRAEDGTFYILDVIRFREEGPEVRRRISNVAGQDGQDIEISFPQDPGQSGKVQARDFVAMLPGWVVHTEGETGSKEVRAEPLAAQANVGNVKLVRGSWNAAFLNEAEMFPNSTHKDQIDAASGAFGRLASGVGTFSEGTVGGLV